VTQNEQVVLDNSTSNQQPATSNQQPATTNSNASSNNDRMTRVPSSGNQEQQQQQQQQQHHPRPPTHHRHHHQRHNGGSIESRLRPSLSRLSSMQQHHSNKENIIEHHQHGQNSRFRRQRRRSSAAFLLPRSGAAGKRHDDDDDDSDDDDEGKISNDNHEVDNQHIDQEVATPPIHDLSALYEHAIRLHATNKINTTNSWNLRLIENIDHFLHTISEDHGQDEDDAHDQNPVESIDETTETTQMMASSGPSLGRVNFTKASCTLDASVKIYGYRVDDVHLTSYKVLANLHRSGNNPTDCDNESSSSLSNNDDTMSPPDILHAGDVSKPFADATNRSHSLRSRHRTNQDDQGQSHTIEKNLGTFDSSQSRRMA
jgi:hypothetical protein